MDGRKLIERHPDAGNATWLDALRGEPAVRDPALAELHELLHCATRAEARRRRASLPEPVSADLDDLCLQAADDALVSIINRLDAFRGDSRFTTWAYGFAIFEISTRLRRHAWRGPRVDLDAHAWERLVDLRSADGPEQLEQREMLRIIRTAVSERLSDRQRLVFEAAVLREVSIDVLAEQLGSTRGAVYKTLHDARRSLRMALIEAGYREMER
jgi:RNA polymerase sigma-70 factor (ECF subfamily)